MLYFTDWCFNPEIKDGAGMKYLYYIVLIVIVNFLMIIQEMAMQLLGKHIIRLKAKINRFLYLRSLRI